MRTCKFCHTPIADGDTLSHMGGQCLEKVSRVRVQDEDTQNGAIGGYIPVDLPAYDSTTQAAWDAMYPLGLVTPYRVYRIAQGTQHAPRWVYIGAHNYLYEFPSLEALAKDIN